MQKLTSVDELRLASVQLERDQAIVREIQDRWPNLKVRYLDPDKLAHATDHPFTIWERCADGVERIVYGFDRIGPELIEDLHKMDQAQVNLDEVVRKIEADAAKQAAEKEAEEDGEAGDLLAVGVKHFNSGKLKFRFTDKNGDKKVVQ